MGFTDDVSMHKYISISQFIYDITSDWSYSETDGIPSIKHIGTENVYIFIPINLLCSPNMNQGAKIKKIDIYYKIAIATLTGMSEPKINKNKLPEHGLDITNENLNVTFDENNNDASKRRAIGSHKLTMTLDTPYYVKDDEKIEINFNFTGGATTETFIYGAQVEFELRL